MAQSSESAQRTTQPNIDPGVDYYHVLEISPQATQDQIRRAYRSAMKRAHPDRVAAEDRLSAETRARTLNHAYRVLSNATYRQKYDLARKNEAVQQQIMSRYAGGFGAPGGEDDLMVRIRDAARADQRRKQKKSDRTAAISLLLAFAVLLAILVALVLIWGVGDALFSIG